MLKNTVSHQKSRLVYLVDFLIWGKILADIWLNPTKSSLLKIAIMT